MFVVDETDDTNFDLVQKLIYNIIRLFKFGKTKFTTVLFGIRARLIARSATYTKAKQVQDFVIRAHPRANKRLYVGRALRYLRGNVVRKLNKASPRIVITILQGSSSDNFRNMRGIISGMNVKLISIGKCIIFVNYFV